MKIEIAFCILYMQRLERICKQLKHDNNTSMTITSHILDTSCGKPAVNVLMILEKEIKEDEWIVIGQCRSNGDGRNGSSLNDNVNMDNGNYRMIFHMKEYFEAQNITDYFYPKVIIQFQITACGEHYHIPLLINPFGYTTYRGS